MSWERFGGLRAAIAQLAAQLMYGQEVKQYFTAKRLAAKRLLGEAGGKKLRYRPMDLPSNGEIKQALLELVMEIEGSVRTRRLFAMRVVALEAMGPLAAFVPRLIGSVATGHVRSGSDIDLHVFAEDPSDVERTVKDLGWTHEVQRVSILKGGKVMEFTHVQVADVFPLELTVYKPRDLRTRPRSSTDGKPIVRISAGALRSLCAKEHPELWKAYEETGAVPSLEEILAAEDEDDAADVLLEDPSEASPPGGEVDPWSDDADVGDPSEDFTASDDSGHGDDDDVDIHEFREDDGPPARRSRPVSSRSGRSSRTGPP
jgi:hypothetical protein